MKSALLSLLVAFLVSAVSPASSQSNPFDLLYPDTLILIEVPDRLDVQEDSAELTIEVKTDSGEEMSHVATLDYIREIEGTNLRAFSIRPEDLKQFQAIVEQMKTWKSQNIHGQGGLEVDFKICRYGPLQKGNSTFIFGMAVEHLPNSTTRFGQLDYETLAGSGEFTDEIVRECPEK